MSWDSKQHSVLADVREALAAPRGDAGVDARMLALDSVQGLIEQVQSQQEWIDRVAEFSADASAAADKAEKERDGLKEQLEALRQAEEAAQVQERVGNEGDADAIRRDAIKRVLGLGLYAASSPAKRPT